VIAAAALLAAALAFSPFQAEEENVRAGNEKLVAGDGQSALRHYDDAERKVGVRPEIDYDRGHAAAKLGKLDEAEQDFRRAAEKAPAPLASRALQNAGNVLAGRGDKKGAIGAYREALRRDPGNEDARYDLEVLLRRAEPPPSGPKPKDGGAEPKPKPGEGEQKGKPSAPQPQGPEPKPGIPRPDPGQGAAGERQPQGERGEERGPRTESLSRQEAERLLDALRARERKLPPDARQGKKAQQPQEVERDW
jgi:tetratricopeptide (TPR) repeat protein